MRILERVALVFCIFTVWLFVTAAVLSMSRVITLERRIEQLESQLVVEKETSDGTN